MTAEQAIQEVLLQEEKRYQAMISRDFDALGQLLSDDLVYTHNNAVVDDKPALLKRIQDRVAVYLKIARSDVKVRLYGDTAVVTGHADITTEKSNPVVRFVNVWVRKDGRWQNVMWQATPFPKQ
jgi:ketosteroid isomerase-like protein